MYLFSIWQYGWQLSNLILLFLIWNELRSLRVR